MSLVQGYYFWTCSCHIPDLLGARKKRLRGTCLLRHVKVGVFAQLVVPAMKGCASSASTGMQVPNIEILHNAKKKQQLKFVFALHLHRRCCSTQYILRYIIFNERNSLLLYLYLKIYPELSVMSP